MGLGSLRHMVIVCCIGLFLAQVARAAALLYTIVDQRKKERTIVAIHIPDGLLQRCSIQLSEKRVVDVGSS